MKVKIERAPTGYWYEQHIGEEFEVVDSPWSDSYTLKEDFDRGHNTIWRHIVKADTSPSRESS